MKIALKMQFCRIVIYRQKGHLAACSLLGRGFEDAANLRGGFLHFKLIESTRLNK